MIKVWPRGCVCQAVLAPGSKVTLADAARLASLAANKGSIRTAPVNQSSGPLAEGCVPTLVISIEINFDFDNKNYDQGFHFSKTISVTIFFYIHG
jgi:hypothetical protein